MVTTPYGGPVTFLFVPSPLVGAATWAPVADLLGGPVADLAGATTPAAVVDAVAAAAAGLEEVVLVPHSNAGLYAPLLAARLGARATVYVDAALAGDGPDTPLAPPRFLELLQDLACDDGLLPPWTRWWEDVSGLFPDDATRAAVEAGQPRLPLAYFTSRVEVPPGWLSRPNAYLAFGDTYADEVALALAHGWPLTTMPGRHLHQLVAPTEVAGAIAELAARAGAP
ncbi:uncharacterized protein PD653_1904 [Nocardioides sp. PD653]|nr:uncharacterized protein PD653_1904 [Nocardioides sp. PD653]